MLKGYDIKSAYMGWVGDRWMQFPNEQEYYEYMVEEEDSNEQI